MAWKAFEYSVIPFKDPARRPYIKVTLATPQGRITVNGLIDSGGRRTIVEKGLASVLGINLRLCEKTGVSGIMGDGEGYMSHLDLTFTDFPSHGYSSDIIFAKMLSTELILGEDFFFKHFKVLFEGNETFKLNPIRRM